MEKGSGGIVKRRIGALARVFAKMFMGKEKEEKSDLVRRPGQNIGIPGSYYFRRGATGRDRSRINMQY